MSDTHNKTNSKVYKFNLTFDEGVIQEIPFKEVVGLEAESLIAKLRNEDHKIFGDDRLPEIIHAENVIFKNGLLQRIDLNHGWFASLPFLDNAEPVIVTVTLLDEEGEPLISWTLDNARPVKVVLTERSLNDEQVIIESMELSHEGMTLYDA